MQIVIPMSGFGERFRRAGYTVPKPLIEVDGKPIIAHVLDMFPGEADITLICNDDHLACPDYRMADVLQALAPRARIIGIPAHKLGPVHAVRQVEHLLDPHRPVVVNYCDFTCFWDWAHFKAFVQATGCAGAIPAYRGFHPHSLGSTNYAYLREVDGWVHDIREKQPFTDDRMEEYASSGTYYFASGALMSEAFRATVDQGLSTGGEFYVSLAYRPLFAQGRAVAVYPLQHFMQWGTPEDLAEYKHWSAAFRHLIEPRRPQAAHGSMVVPMAGLGQRFAQAGYPITKPLIPVSGRPMVLQAAGDLPAALQQVFVMRADMPGQPEIAREVRMEFTRAVIEVVERVTQGQACTALIGLDALEREQVRIESPVTIGTCDNGALYDPAALHALIIDSATDVIVWGVRGHANALRHPQMFGWIDADESGAIRRVSVKAPLASPATDPIVLGTFTFRRAEHFRAAVQRLMARDGRINGEFYIDACINDAIAAGLRCRLFEVDSYLSWGTPNDLKTFEYWQSCFHKWPSHPYRLELDSRVPAASAAGLAERYRATVPALPVRRP